VKQKQYNKIVSLWVELGHYEIQSYPVEGSINIWAMDMLRPNGM